MLYLKTGNNKITILIILLIAIFCSCTNNNEIAESEYRLILREKGLNEMETSLKPLILKSKQEFYGLYEISKKNSLAALNNKGEFCTLNIDKVGQVQVDTIKWGFPGKSVSKCGSSPEHNMLWAIRVRGLYILDIKSKQSRFCSASGESNAEINTVQLIDPEKKLFLIELVDHAIEKAPYCFNIIYDFINDKIIYESPLINATMFSIKPNLFLTYDYTYVTGSSKIWFLCDSRLENRVENKLTKELTKLQISSWPYSRTIHMGKRMLLGTSEPMGILTYYTARWDEGYEEVKIEPIILQRFIDLSLGADFQFSIDGNWVKSILKEKNNLLNMPRLIIYHAKNIYPQGLSMPIIGGYTDRNNPGAFMQHEEWGPCYVEQDPNHPDKLFVYKLNEGLKLLAEQAKNAIKP